MYKDTLASLKSASEGRLSEVQGKVSAAEAEVKSFDALSSDIEAEGKAAVDASYDEGYAKGLAASGQPDDSKQFSLEELNAEIKAATDPINVQLADKNVALESMKSDLDAVKKELADLKALPVPEVPAPVDTAPLEAKIASLTSENGVLKAAIQAEIDDSKVDSARLEAAVAPVIP